MRRPRLIALGIFFVCAVPCLNGRAGAHGDVHQQILDVSAAIERLPKEARLYMMRGELYRDHGLTEEAVADFQKALELDPARNDAWYSSGRALFEAKRYEESLTHLDQCLKALPNHPEALVYRAYNWVRLGETEKADAGFERAMPLLDPPQPDDYLEWARMHETLGGEHRLKALEILDRGVERLGPLVALQLHAIDLETEMERYDGALARLATLEAQSQRKEGWLVRRAEILLRAGRLDEATAAADSAQAALDAVPELRRQTPQTRGIEKSLGELKEQIREARAKS